MAGSERTGGIPTTDAESRRWLNFWNSSDEEIPPFGCVWVAGKRLVGQWSEQNLPKDGDPSWDDLQKEVGYGNLLLVGRKPYLEYDWGVFNHAGFVFNGPTPVPPKKWGKCTADFPAVARVRSTYRRGDELVKLGGSKFFRPTRDSWDLVNANDGGTRYGYGWGVGDGFGGWGLGGRWAYGSPAVFWCADMIEGFNSTEGLAWVKPGQPAKTPDGFRVRVGQSYGAVAPGVLDIAVADGSNDVELQPYYYGDPEGIFYANTDVRLEDGWLTFRTPGIYSIDIQFTFVGSTDGPADGDENPYSQLRVSPVATGATVGSNACFVTLAPPVLKQGSYGVDSTYITHYESDRLLMDMVIPEPDDYDPTAQSQPVLASVKLVALRTTNHPDGMAVYMRGDGRVTALGANPLQDTDSSTISP